MSEKKVAKRANRRKKKVPELDTSIVQAVPAMDFRDRVRAVAEIVHAAFGIDPESHPVCDTRDACRVVISLVISSLVNGGKAVTTEELTAMSKLLTEHRKLEIADKEVEGKYGAEVSKNGTSRNSTSGKLPGDLGRAVKDIYGTNLSE